MPHDTLISYRYNRITGIPDQDLLNYVIFQFAVSCALNIDDVAILTGVLNTRVRERPTMHKWVFGRNLNSQMTYAELDSPDSSTPST